MKQIHNAFTLVELIVVVTILAILATIGFVSYSGYLTGVRDTNRIASLTAISDGLELYRTKNDLPLPDNSVEVQVESETIARQGYAGSNVLQTIEYSKAGKDPKDDQYYSYYLTDDKKHYQMMAFLEESDNLETKLNHPTQPHPQSLSLGGEGSSPKLFSSLTKGEMSEGQRGLLLGLETTFAATDYSNRHPKVYGKRLGILTDSDNTPIQEISTIKLAGNLNMTGGTSEQYIARLTDIVDFSGSGSTLTGLKTVQKTKGIQSSCKHILDKNKTFKGKDGVYTIGNNGRIYDIYCDMTTDDGGWTYATLISHHLWDINIFYSDNTNKITTINTPAETSRGQLDDIWTDSQAKDLMIICKTNDARLIKYQQGTIFYSVPYDRLEMLVSDDWTGKKMLGGVKYSACGDTGTIKDQFSADNSGAGGSHNMYINDKSSNKRIMELFRNGGMWVRPDSGGCAQSSQTGSVYYSQNNYCMTAIR